MEQPKYITMAEAAEITPRRPHAATIWRWARNGLPTDSGQRVRLQYCRIGRRMYTTAAWLEEFFRQLAEADVAAPVLQHPNRHDGRPMSIRHELADAELREAGL